MTKEDMLTHYAEEFDFISQVLKKTRDIRNYKFLDLSISEVEIKIKTKNDLIIFLNKTIDELKLSLEGLK